MLSLRITGIEPIIVKNRIWHSQLLFIVVEINDKNASIIKNNSNSFMILQASSFRFDSSTYLTKYIGQTNVGDQLIIHGSHCFPP